jgi:hypothetical protein
MPPYFRRASNLLAPEQESAQSTEADRNQTVAPSRWALCPRQGGITLPVHKRTIESSGCDQLTRGLSRNWQALAIQEKDFRPLMERYKSMSKPMNEPELAKIENHVDRGDRRTSVTPVSNVALTMDQAKQGAETLSLVSRVLP